MTTHPTNVNTSAISRRHQVRLPRAAGWRKLFVFSSLPIRKGLILIWVSGVRLILSWQERRSYYLFFNYLFFNYLDVCSVWTDPSPWVCSVWTNL